MNTLCSNEYDISMFSKNITKIKLNIIQKIFTKINDISKISSFKYEINKLVYKNPTNFVFKSNQIQIFKLLIKKLIYHKFKF